MKIKSLFQRSTISGRLIAFSAVFVAAAVVVASIILWLIVAGVVREQIDQRLDTQIEGLRSALTGGPDGTIALSAQLDGPPFDRAESGWYWQISGEGVQLASRSLAGGTIEMPGQGFEWRQLLGGGPRPGRTTELHGQALHVRIAQASVGNTIVAITATAPKSALIGPAIRSLLWLLPAMLLLGASLLVGTFLQVRYGLRPLRQLKEDINSIVAGRQTKLSDRDVEELRPVAAEINRLIDQGRQRLIDTRVHFANMAHGLKTPVASMMLALTDRNDPDGSMRQLTERIDRRIRHHLADARRASVGDAVRSVCVVRPRLDDVVLALTRIYADKQLSVSNDVDTTIAVDCSAEDFDEIFGNILDNAFKWAERNIRISASVQGQAVTITIDDDGPGMPESRIDEAFRPGLRLDETVPGDGFGLGISREIVELYGGRVSISPARPGLKAAVTLPVAQGGSASLKAE